MIGKKKKLLLLYFISDLFLPVSVCNFEREYMRKKRSEQMEGHSVSGERPEKRMGGTEKGIDESIENRMAGSL